MNKIMHPIEPEELMAYVDGELPADRATATAAHLGECAECQNVVTELRSVSQELNAWKVGTVGSEMPQAITGVLEQHKSQPRKAVPDKPRSWRNSLGLRWQTAEWMGALAVVFLVVIGTVRFIGGNANNVFSSIGSAISGDELSTDSRQGSASPSASVSARQEVRSPAAFRAPAGSDRVHHITASKGQGAPVSELAAQLEGGEKVTVEHAIKSGTKLGESLTPTANGPMIIRTAQLSVITKEFDKARTTIEATLKRHRGYVGELKVGGATGSGRTLTATLRVPADQLDATLAELKALGRVESESQGGEDVTTQYVDLQARLANARNTSQRLTELLQNRTGKLSDVLEVEQELDRVRGEIEQMEAERKNMTNQVSFATLNVTVSEDYKAQLQVVPPSTWTRLGNAAVEGYRSVVEGILSVALFLLTTGPSLLLWGAIFFFPARFVWRRARKTATS